MVTGLTGGRGVVVGGEGVVVGGEGVVIGAVFTACTVKGARPGSNWKLAVLLTLMRAKGEMENTVAVSRPLLSLTHWKETLRRSMQVVEADSRISDTWFLFFVRAYVG